jgi:predicted nucleotidyltransferase
MDLSHPQAAVCPSLEGEILVTLARTSRPMTGREVARLVRRGSQSGINRALRRLAEHGIVLRQEAGRAILFTLNRDHLGAGAVEQLASIRERLFGQLKARCAEWRIGARHVSVFGSAARGDGGTESDIDVFIVRPRNVDADTPQWREQLDALARDVERWTGNAAGISEVSERELSRLRKEKPAVADELRKDAHVLIGEPISNLLGKAR